MQAYDWVEYFSGTGNVSAAFREVRSTYVSLTIAIAHDHPGFWITRNRQATVAWPWTSCYMMVPEDLISSQMLDLRAGLRFA